jgi:hypothetical protein
MIDSTPRKEYTMSKTVSIKTVARSDDAFDLVATEGTSTPRIGSVRYVIVDPDDAGPVLTLYGWAPRTWECETAEEVAALLTQEGYELDAASYEQIAALVQRGREALAAEETELCGRFNQLHIEDHYEILDPETGRPLTDGIQGAAAMAARWPVGAEAYLSGTECAGNPVEIAS